MYLPQIRIPATYMRGGTSKGVFFNLADLPHAMQQPGPIRDQTLLRVIGSPDHYGKQTDGMGGATSSTSKVVIISKSERADHDVDYLFGQVSIDKPMIDWSGNCGNLSSAVGPFAIAQGLVDASRVPANGIATVRVWQQNIGKTIVANVPIHNGLVQEMGDFELDGVTFPAAEIELAFKDPAADGALFPTGNSIDTLVVPKLGEFEATLINAGIPTVFVRARDLGFTGTELQSDINSDADALQRLELVRAHGALRMGLISDLDEAQSRQHTPKVAFVAEPASYQASSGKQISSQDIDLVVRAMSMGQLHHAMMGTAAVAISVAAAVPGTIVNQVLTSPEGNSVCFGHPSGTLKVGASAYLEDGQWRATEATMSRSARVLMEGWVRVPGACLA
ncbi:putative methylaconitate Delta-isomerase PrpF [Arenicella chitinivorans]|uniref:Methylaconitate Delta-isomerase PrpF n=1 Tax=Arenicella chitinivorans TaxID=1329800 RepID=A0A918S0K4_9GAMM|nr:2-methylaconitate cis-trans isomerase PrpF [Arenicella chitinivorans]GHA15898.1 putative methylaconitate Delta-isomerase PrpF [Arenicella chitinivorans]